MERLFTRGLLGFPIQMIERVDRTYTKEEVMSLMEPLISTWFDERFGDLTIPQAKAIPVIHQRRSVLESCTDVAVTESGGY